VLVLSTDRNGETMAIRLTITQEMNALGIPKTGWLPEDESDIVHNPDLSFEDKLAKLQAIRAANA